MSDLICTIAPDGETVEVFLHEPSHVAKLAITAAKLERENTVLRDALAEIEAGSVGWKEEVARAALEAAKKENL